MSTAIANPPPDALFELVTDQWTEPFWQAARAHRLVVARCAACGQHRMPPTPFCPACHATTLDWTEVTGRGTLYAFTVVRRANLPEVQDALPYAPCVVELDGVAGIRLISNIVGAEVDSIRIGATLEVVWHDRSDGVSLPYFRIVTDG